MPSEMIDGFVIAAAAVLIVWIGAMVIATRIPPVPSVSRRGAVDALGEGGVQVSVPARPSLDDPNLSA